MRIGIDLLWVRPGINGGTESFIRNLLDGFARYDTQNEYHLFAARDNADSFAICGESPRMILHRCPVSCAIPAKRILWENLFLDRYAARIGVDVMFIPVYSMPRTWGSGIPYVCVIHDVQALHYPEYFSWPRKNFFRAAWSHTCRAAACVVTDSEYCRRDLEERYPIVCGRIRTIYVPVAAGALPVDSAVLTEKYDLEPEKYFYCVSSMLPHKNLNTLLRMMALLKEKNSESAYQGLRGMPLVISGVGGRTEEFRAECSRLGITDCVIETGYVSDAERDCLYENCRTFLFPSVFEGFGMPPIEAMRKGRRVVMTRCSCLEEITRGRAVYVDRPLDAEEWLERLAEAQIKQPQAEPFEEYLPETIVHQYMELFTKCAAYGRKTE